MYYFIIPYILDDYSWVGARAGLDAVEKRIEGIEPGASSP
jgi:hypothetical protein